MLIPSGYGLKINCIYSAPIRKTALSELSFCSCGYFAKEIFKIMLIHASMIRKFLKIALALNSCLSEKVNSARKLKFHTED